MDKAQKRRFRPEGLLLGALALLAAVLCIVYFRQIAQAVGLFADYRLCVYFAHGFQKHCIL